MTTRTTTMLSRGIYLIINARSLRAHMRIDRDAYMNTLIDDELMTI